MGRIQDLKQAVQEVGTSYLDPLVNRDLMTLEELKYKLKNKEIGKEWYEQEVRKLKALSKVANITGSAAWDAVPSDAQEIIKSGLQHTGKFLGSTGQVLGEAWQGARTVENWKDPRDIAAAGTARAIEGGLEFASWVPKGLIWGSHNILRMHKPVANIAGTAASFYVTPGRIVSSSYNLLNAAAKSRMVLNTAARLNQTRFMDKTGNLYQRVKNVPADKRIVNIQNMRGNQLPSEGRTSAFLKEGSMFKTGSAAQERAIQQRRFLRAQEGDPTAGILLYDDTVPQIHNLTSKTQADWIEKTLKPWVLENQSRIKENKLFTNKNIGDIILDNKAKRVSTSGVAKFLKMEEKEKGSGDIKHLKLTDSKAGVLDNRRIAAEVKSSPVAMQTLETANQRWLEGAKTVTGGRAGVNPAWLNTKSYRAGQIRGANFSRQIFHKMRKIPGFEEFGVEQGHLIDLIESGGVDAMRGFGPETTIANKFWNRLEFGGTVINREAAEILGISPGTWKAKAQAITSKGPLALQRKAEYEQYGVLTEIWEQALLASETKGQSMEKAIKTITEYRDQIAKGDISSLQGSFKIPGSFVTIDDMLAIQILSLKGMNPAEAAERVVAERLAWELAIEAGAANNHNTLKTLAQQMKHINTEIAVRKAVEQGAPAKGYRFSSMTVEEQMEWATRRPGMHQVLESQATGKLGNKPTDPLPQSKLQELKSKLKTIINTNG